MPSMRTSRGLCRRGSALIEALVVSTLIVAFFGATLFFYQLHDRKGATLREARHRAWAATHFECEGREVAGHDARAVRLPRTMARATSAAGTLSIETRTTMACNVQPRDDDTPLAALQSIGDLIGF